MIHRSAVGGVPKKNHYSDNGDVNNTGLKKQPMSKEKLHTSQKQIPDDFKILFKNI